MKVLFLISGNKVPSSRFRVLNYIPFLEEAGIRCTVLPSFPSKYQYFSWIGFRPSQRLKRFTRYLHYLFARVKRYDLVVIERELFDNDTCDMELKFIHLKSKTILDIDDAVFIRYPNKFKIVAKNVDLIIAGNENLFLEAKKYNENVRLLPTSVLTRQYPVKEYSNEAEGKVVIGWTGLDGNIPSLKQAVNALNRLSEEFDFTLCIISQTPDNINDLKLTNSSIRHVQWSSQREYQDLAEFDIGIMPLVDDQWSRYKCGLKLIQYMALGIPAVVSPVGVNAEIIKHGCNGFFATTDEQWSDTLKQLLISHKLRKELGLRARSDVEKRYSVEANSVLLKQFLEDVNQS